MGNAYSTFIGKPEGKKSRGRICVGEKIILEWVLGK
jgi:hypothetical protein